MRTAGVFLLSFDILFIAASVYLITTFRDFNSNSVQVSGTISSINVFGKSKPRYTPTVRFETLTGVPIEFEDSTYTRHPDYQVGDQVEVLYDTRDPSNAKLASTFSSLLFLPIVFTGVSVILASVGVLLLILDRRARRRLPVTPTLFRRFASLPSTTCSRRPAARLLITRKSITF